MLCVMRAAAIFYATFEKLHLLLPFPDSLNKSLSITLDTVSFSFMCWSLKDSIPFCFNILGLSLADIDAR